MTPSPGLCRSAGRQARVERQVVVSQSKWPRRPQSQPDRRERRRRQRRRRRRRRQARQPPRQPPACRLARLVIVIEEIQCRCLSPAASRPDLSGFVFLASQVGRPTGSGHKGSDSSGLPDPLFLFSEVSLGVASAPGDYCCFKRTNLIVFLSRSWQNFRLLAFVVTFGSRQCWRRQRQRRRRRVTWLNLAEKIPAEGAPSAPPWTRPPPPTPAE